MHGHDCDCDFCEARRDSHGAGRDERAREAAHERAMERWAKAYQDLDGAPESDEDR